MMLPQVFISGLLLLLPGAVDSDVEVTAVLGDPVTLPCTYSTDLGISDTCWGLGECQSFYCARTLIWTKGYRVTYQRSSRYQLKGPISEGNVSLTIENAAQSDSGPYCCIVEIPGSFSYVTYMLEVKPDQNTTVTGWNNTLTSSNNSWDNYTESIPSLNPQEKMNEGFTFGTTITALMLLLFVSALAFTGW